MKKLHGTYSIQPLTITDAVIAEDAKISESKLDLHLDTAEIQQTLDGLSANIAAHILADSDPHGETLHQTILQTEDIRSGTSDGTRVVSISNPGNGDVTLSVEGDISAVNATFSGDTSIAGITTIGGQTHITGNVVIDGNLSVSGETTTVESTTIDYDSLLITPTSKTNVTGLVIAPDGTGSPSAPSDTFTGNLMELQKRVSGINSAAVIVDKDGNLKLFTGNINLKGAVVDYVSNVLTVDKAMNAPSITLTDGGLLYSPASDNQPGTKIFDIQDSLGVSNAFITKNGDATVNSLTIGISNPITESSGGLNIPDDMVIVNSEVKLDDSVLTLSAENKDDWSILNRNSSVSFYHDDEQSPQVELSDDLFDLSNCELTKTDDLLVLGAATFSGNVNMGANMTMDGIKVGSHDHTGGDMGTVLPQTAVTGLKTFIDNINTTIQSCVNTMTTSNTESGINVAFNSTSKKLDFTVNDFTLTLTGDAAGSATVAHASNTSLAVTVKDSAKLGGLSLPSTTANTEANKVLRTDGSGNTTVKNLTINPPAAGMNTIDKVFATYANDNTIRYYTPANFATQILALGGTTKNSHTHTAVNGLTPVRGSSTFNGVSGRVIMLSTTRANTNYSVAITPTAQPNGTLGEVWVIKATDRFTVYNSGVATSAFDYIMIG